MNCVQSGTTAFSLSVTGIVLLQRSNTPNIIHVYTYYTLNYISYIQSAENYYNRHALYT
jgi:hypothetical protein